MLFSSQLPLASLIDLCRVLRHSLGAGLTLRDVFRQQATRGTRPVRPIAARIGAALETGDSLEDALQREAAHFPPLLVAMASVAEHTGTLPEVFGELEKYYLMQQKLRREFRSQITLPVVQFVLALLIIGFLLFVLGSIAGSRGGKPADVTGLGLTGTRGAVIWLAGSFGFIAILIVGYLFLSRTLRRRPAVDEMLLRIPILGPCLRAFALGRFALGLQLTLETGMPITRALRLSLEATGNSAFVARVPVARQAIKGGDDLSETLAKCRLFPEEFVNIVAVAEESGRVPEVMRHQAEYYAEEAGRRLKALTRAAGFGVYALYAVFMIIMIFRIAGVYFSALGSVR